MHRALAPVFFLLAACTSASDEAPRPRGRADLDAPARNSAPPTSAPAPAPPTTPAAHDASAPSSPPAEVTPSTPPAPAIAPPTARADLVSACDRRPELACTRAGDLDGDGQTDTIALVRPTDDAKIGLLITWGRGGSDLLGAGATGQTWREQIDDSARAAPIPTDLDFLARWDLWPAVGPADRRRGFRDPRRPRTYRAPAVRGDGLLVDGGDSAAVAYWDGARWRLHYLGF